MNITLNPSTFSLSEIFLADKKRNVLINGYFTKILYSNQYLVLNSIYYHISFVSSNIISTESELFMQYDICNARNICIIKELSDIEYKLLDYYKHFYNLPVNISTSIEKRLQYGKIKLYCEDNNAIAPNTQIVIKISGIWETAHEIGLAIKFFPATSINSTAQ
jgi:hypothetical protein